MFSFFFLACGTSEKTSDTSESTVETISWTKDIQPIVEQHCTRCHLENGQGTGDFTKWEDVEIMADLMLNAMESGRMPPPAADPNCHDYADSEALFMPEESKALFAKWVSEGKRYGDEADILEYDRSLVDLEDPNMVVTMQEPYTPSFTDEDNPGNEYRCFSIAHNQDEPFYITELHPIVDNAALVHHIVLAKGTEAGILPGSDSPEGVDCIRDGAFVSGDYQESGMLSGWAPGMSPIRFPDGAGLRVDPDEYIVIQMHYYQSTEAGEGATDQSGYSFKTTTERPEQVVQMIPIGMQDFVIPAEEESYTMSEEFTIPLDLKLWGVFPHMHVLGSGYSMSADNQCIIESDRYDFENQMTYMYEEPILIPANSPINFSCTWNNSVSNPDLIHNPPIDANYGERTDEEMCYMFSLISL